MPIYEYKCEDCGNEFEKLVVRAADGGAVACPSCGQAHPTQRFSTFAAVTGASSSHESASGCPSAGSCPNSGMCGMG